MGDTHAGVLGGITHSLTRLNLSSMDARGRAVPGQADAGQRRSRADMKGPYRSRENVKTVASPRVGAAHDCRLLITRSSARVIRTSLLLSTTHRRLQRVLYTVTPLPPVCSYPLLPLPTGPRIPAVARHNRAGFIAATFTFLDPFKHKWPPLPPLTTQAPAVRCPQQRSE